jgi:2-hydroxy-3-oxopropionate reductase
METVKSVGVIGLGVVGKPMALRLVKAGFEVAVYDVRDEPVAALTSAGATACGSSGEVAERSEVIVSLVADGVQTDDVVFGERGILKSTKPGSLFIVGSTLGPAPVQKAATALALKGCDTLDMPFTGGYIAAQEGKLALMVGGREETIARATPVLRALATTITRAGPIGAGQVAKLAHQLVLTVNVTALLEGLALGAAGGVDPVVMRQILKDGLASSGALEVWHDLGPRWKAMFKPAQPGAPLPNLRKDLHSALDLAQALGLDLRVAAHAARIADSGCLTGHDNPAL